MEFRITKPGKYLTRCGAEVDVEGGGSELYPWEYYIEGDWFSVDDFGSFYRNGDRNPYDIIAKAHEAEPTKEEAPKKDDGGPAFPMPEPNIPAGHYYEGPGAHPGMTLRDYVAIKALQAIIQVSSASTRIEDVETAFLYADDFLTVRGGG